MRRPMLRLISNRDEFFERPTAPAHWWNSGETGARAWIFGGRDLRAGGSWLGMNRALRFSVLTNFREPNQERPAHRSRGELIEYWLASKSAEIPADVLANGLAKQAHNYAGFNLLLFDLSDDFVPKAWAISNRAEATIQAITPGIHGLSNALLDSSWPKSETLKQVLRDTRDRPSEAFVAHALAALQDRQEVSDALLPSTGIDLVRERSLSSVFVSAAHDTDLPVYGTRASTVFTISRSSTKEEPNPLAISDMRRTGSRGAHLKMLELTHGGGAGEGALAGLSLERRFSFPL